MHRILIPIVFLITVPCCAQTLEEQAAGHAQAAQQAEAKNDFPSAVREYETVVKMLPGNAEMESNLGVALYFAGDKDRSLDVMQKALARNQNLFVPHLFSGLALFQLSQPDRAVPELERAVHLNGEDATAHLWLGYAYSAQEKYEASIAEFLAASRLQPENADAWYGLGQSYLRVGEDATKKLFSVAGNSGRAWQLAGEQYLLRGDRDQAVKMFEGALERRSDLVDLRNTLLQMGESVPASTMKEESAAQRDAEDGLYAKAHGSEKKAEEAFRKIAELAPDSYRAHQVLGDSFAAQKRPEEAIQEYRAALALKPDQPELHAAIANNNLRLGKTEEALAEFRAELAIRPNSATACEGIGRVLAMQGKYNEAGEMLQRALQLDRPPLEAYRLMGKVELVQRKYDAAIRLLLQYVASRPDDSTAWYLLANAYRGKGNTAKTQQALDAYKRTSIDAKERAQASKAVAMFLQENQQQESTN